MKRRDREQDANADVEAKNLRVLRLHVESAADAGGGRSSSGRGLTRITLVLFQNILCPVDFSEPSQFALRTATLLAIDCRAELVVVHVWQSPLHPEHSELILQNQILASVKREKQDALAASKRDVEALGLERVRTKLLYGVPWDAIVRESCADSYDVVVMGTHGRTGLKHVLLGSVAERVARHAGCPVLLVRPRDCGEE